MNSSWHLFFENLKHSPELIDEELQDDVLTLNEKSHDAKITHNEKINPEEKRNYLVQSLQKKYGNHSLQKLLNASIVHPSKQKKHRVQSEKQPSTKSKGSSKDLSNKQIDKNKLEKSGEAHMDRIQSKEKAPEKKSFHKEGKEETLFTLFLQSLPVPSEKQLNTLNKQYTYLDRIEQGTRIENIVAYIWRLPQAQKSTLLHALKLLSSRIKSNAFLLALLSGLYKNASFTASVVDGTGEEP